MRTVMRMFLALLVVIMVGALPADASRGGHSRHGGGRVGVGVFIDPGWWGPRWWGPYPYYSPYYYAPPVVVQQPPEIYVQPAPQAEEPRYWYFCPDPQGYYPDVKRCPKGWLKVVPPAEAPEGEE